MVALCANLSCTKGHDVQLIYSRRRETPENLRDLFSPEISFYEIDLGGISAIINCLKLRRLLKKMDPQVVHLHSSFAGFAGRLALVHALPKATFFYSPHCISFMRKDIGFKKLAFAALELLASIKKCTYVACSNSEKSAIARWIFKSALVLENAVPDKHAGLPARHGHKRELRIVTAGGIRSQKGFSHFMSISRKSAELDIPVEFVWIGDGEKIIRDELESSGVRVTGWLSSAEVFSELSTADIYLSTSLREGMPVSVLEAMRAGVPVLASNCAGNIDVVEDRVTGLIFKSPHEAAQIILGISQGHIITSDIRESAYRQIQTRFSKMVFDNNLHDMYSLRGKFSV
jgi:glycosyltransferase involved in cell wall biosynthesis